MFLGCLPSSVKGRFDGFSLVLATTAERSGACPFLRASTLGLIAEKYLYI
jgi:hypothetical protein